MDNSLFLELKHKCVNCVNEPTKQSIECLHSFIRTNDPNLVNSLHEYIIFPLRLIIANIDNGHQLLVSTVDCLSLILSKSHMTSLDIFTDIWVNLFHLIDSNANNSYSSDEDIVVTVLKCSKCLLQSCDNSIICGLISDSLRPHLGHTIYLLLKISCKHKYSLIKCESMNTLNCILNKCQSIVSDGDVEDVIAFFLPGIAINISNLIASDDKLKTKVITDSLQVLANTIIFVFKTIDTQSIHLNNDFTVNRDMKWLTITCDKLLIIFNNIFSNIICHQNWSVRQSLASFATELLSNCCQQFVDKCLLTLIKIPLTYLNDDYQLIRYQSESFLNTFSKSFNNNKSNSWTELIGDQMYVYITRLPRIIRRHNQSEKCIYLLNGYLKCLDNNGINDLLHSPQHKQKLFESLIDICELNFDGIEPLEQLANTHLNVNYMNVNIDWVKKNFKYLTNQTTIKAVINCCQLIGKSCDTLLLEDYLLQLLRQSKLNPSLIFVNNIIISSIDGSYRDIEEVVELYLSNITISLEEKTIEEMNKDVVKQCLLIEGLALFSSLYPRDGSDLYLIKTIYPLLQCLGSANFNIFQSSNMAFTLICTHFGYNSIQQLIHTNVDYIINSISINLQHFINYQNIPIVMKVVLKYSNQEMVHLFSDPIKQIINIIDLYFHSKVLPLMEVLYAYSCTLCAFYLPKSHIYQKMTDNFDTRGDKFVKLIEDFVHNQKVSQDMTDMTGLDSECDQESESLNVNNFYVSIVVEILDRCVHLMSSSQTNVRLIVLDIVINCLNILSQFQDDLLPMAHKLWSPLVDRFGDKDIIVVKRAFTCLLVMSETCGDFIRARTLKQVLPQILSFLKSQSKISFKKDKASAYRFTIEFQFQQQILSNIALIAINLDLKEKHLWQIIVEVIPYLNTFQPIPLQESAVMSLQKISLIDHNSVIYFLKMTYSESDAKHKDKKMFHFIKFNDKKIEFKNNVTKLFNDMLV